MIGGGAGASGAHCQDGAAGNLHTLTVSLAALQRLLERRNGDGALVQADPALIAATIAAGREEIRRVSELVAAVQNEPTDAFRSMALTLVAAVAELDGVLIVMEGSLRRLATR